MAQRVDVWQFEFARRHWWWAFVQMGKSLLAVEPIPGLSFVKQLGTGAGSGFSVFPNFGQYVWVLTWTGENPSELARVFYESHPVFQEHVTKSSNRRWWSLQGIRSHGTWNGQTPFSCAPLPDPTGAVAVITRASIERSQFWRFWSRVPASARMLRNRPGLEFAVGIGELPLVEQATFSVWQNQEVLDSFAYRTPGHSKRIQETHRFKWYKEEQFTRFAVLASGQNGLPL